MTEHTASPNPEKNQKIGELFEAYPLEDYMKLVDILERMITSGVLDFRNGKMTLHFDSDGNLRGINIDQWTDRS